MANLYNRKKSIRFSSQNKPSISLFLRGVGALITDTTIIRDDAGVVSSVHVNVKSALVFYTLQQKFTDFGVFTVVDSNPTPNKVNLKSVCDFYEYLRGLGYDLVEEYITSGILEYKGADGRSVSVTYSTEF